MQVPLDKIRKGGPSETWFDCPASTPGQVWQRSGKDGTVSIPIIPLLEGAECVFL